MRIGLVTPSVTGGGAEAVAYAWSEELTRRGHMVHVMCYASGSALPEGRSGELFPGRGPVARWTRLPRWVAAVVEKQRLDVVLSVLDFSNICALRAALRHRVPVIISEHSVPSLLWCYDGRSGQVKRFLARRLYRRADGVVAVSHAVAADLRSGYRVPPERLLVLPNPITPAGRPRAAAGGPRLVYAGRLTAPKRPAVLLDALIELKARDQAWSGLVIGDGPLRKDLELRAEASALPIRFAGWVEDWRALTARGDVLLLPSDVEGFGNVLVEAALVDVPAVAPSTALGVGDAIVAGVTGVLARSPRPVDLADAAQAAARLRPVPEAVSAWAVKFSPTAVGDELERMLERAVEHWDARPTRRRR